MKSKCKRKIKKRDKMELGNEIECIKYQCRRQTTLSRTRRTHQQMAGDSKSVKS